MSSLAEATPTSPSNQRAPTDDGAVPILGIEPSHGWISLKLDELWEYRELHVSTTAQRR